MSGAYLQLIYDNLKSFSALLVADPLFQVDTLLAVPDVVLHPTTNEVFKLVMQCVRDCVEGYDRLFVRDVIYTSHAYATMSVSVCLSVCL